ncbi:MAG TPA: pyridoxal-dependent decarboxylase, partial [Actinoplanes sp.]|nr:pyridoxal-dependent decarboxylase [Actinoplanes sp.]
SAHHAVTNVIQRLGLTAVPIRADALGEIDYDDLAEQVNLRRHVSAIVVANIGSAVTEAVDDVPRIVQVLDRCAVRRRWIHGDAALSGIPLALLDPDERPAIDFSAGIDSIVTSGHKFLGSPVPSAVVVVRNSHRLAHVRAVTYTGSPDTTVGNSRSGLAALVLWYALRTHGLDGLRARAEQSRQLAAATHDALREIGWPAHRHKHAMSVSFPTPPASVTAKWVLATHGDTSLIVCMPGVTAEQIDAFVADLRAAITADAATAATSELPALSNGATATVPAQPGPRDFTVAPNGAPAAPSGGSGATPLPTIRQSRPPVAAPSPAAAPNPAAPNPAAPNPAAANPAAANPAAASAGAPADTGAVEVRPDTAPAAAAPPPMGPLLPTPPQSLQRRKMLRRAGMSIRL